MIKKVIKLSDFPILKKLLSKGKTIIASNKKNYSVELEQLKGKQIIHTEEHEAIEGQRKNTLQLNFDTLDRQYFHIFNGTIGDKGIEGDKGDKGNKGESFNKYEMLNRSAVTDALVIVNDDDTNDPTAVWSAYRGKVLEEFLKSIAETIITDDEYQLLFNEQIFIDLEFTTHTDNKATALIHNDNKKYKTYIKYWTYEEDSAQSYYILQDGEYIEVPNFDLWNDLYLNPENTKTYYTRKLIITEVDQVTGDVLSSEYQYTAIDVPVWLDLEFTTTTEDQTSQLLTSSEISDDGEVSHEEKEEEIIILHRPITSISIDGDNHITIPINSILVKGINIQPVDYLNSPICIEYDETKIQVFEDGRIMALQNNCETTIKIYSEENPGIFANIYVTVITYVDSIQFNTNLIKAFKGYKQAINYTILPETASNKNIEWSSTDKEIAEVDPNGFTKEEANIANANIEGAWLYGITVKVPSIEAVEAVEGIHYTEEEITAAVEGDDAYGKTIDDWKVEPVEAIEGQPEILYTDEEVTEHNKTIENAIWEGEIKIILNKEGQVTIYASTTDGSNVVSRIDVIVDTAVSDILFNDMVKHEVNEMTQEENYSAEILVGIPTNISVNVLPETASNKNLVWESTNENIIVGTADDGCTGQIFIPIKTEGEIKVYPEDGSDVLKTISVASKYPVTFINMNISNANIDLGDTLQLVAEVNDIADNKEIRWSSSNPSIADVDQNGLVTTYSGGDVIITAAATDGSGVTATCDITSVVLITNINIEQDVELHIGNTYKLNYKILPQNANITNINWYTSNESIAEVDNLGIIRPHKEGNIKVYAAATDNSGIIASTDVKITVPTAELLLSEYELSLNVDEIYTLVATVVPDDTSNQNVEYISNDENIATIDNNGNIIAINKGTTSIFVKTTDNTNLSTECVVNVL